MIQNDIEETNLVLKVSLQNFAILTAGDIDIQDEDLNQIPAIQIMTNALIMFQSVEHPDASGSKTFHVSMKDYRVSINPRFEAMATSHSPPIIGPVAIDFRSVNGTENKGIVVKRDISISSDVLNSAFQSKDIRLILLVAKQLTKEVKSFHYGRKSATGSDILRNDTKEKDSFIATTISFQLQPFSFVLMKYSSKLDILHPLVNLRAEVLGKFEGCTSSLFGDLKVETSLYFFGKSSQDWEPIIEPVSVAIECEQQPNHSVSFLAISFLY